MNYIEKQGFNAVCVAMVAMVSGCEPKPLTVLQEIRAFEAELKPEWDEVSDVVKASIMVAPLAEDDYRLDEARQYLEKARMMHELQKELEQ